MFTREIAGMTLVWIGILFFLTTAVGMVRFPDTISRLHALAKADNPGLGCVAIGLALMQTDWFDAGKLLLIWGVALFGSATSAFSLARHMHQSSSSHPKPDE